MKEIYSIQSGEMKIAQDGLFSILLGSCVSVLIFDSELKIGAANHFLLPTRKQSENSAEMNSLHFGDESILELLKELKSKGSKRDNLVVKLVGGAGEPGLANIEVAERTLQKFGLEIKSRSVGGLKARKLLFDPTTGELKVKLLVKAKTFDKMLRPSLILIGSSTGGTEVVQEILASLPAFCPPVLVVQHMPKDFIGAYTARLNIGSGITVKEAVHREKLNRGQAYIASGGKHMACEYRDGDYYIELSDEPPINQFKPSVDFLFHSVSSFESSSRVLAILLSGMGSDGARGLYALKNKGAYTIGQSEETCLIYGMPRAAFEIGATSLMASPQEIIDFISSSLANFKVA